jgi:hypothetical protein
MHGSLLANSQVRTSKVTKLKAPRGVSEVLSVARGGDGLDRGVPLVDARFADRGSCTVF